MRRLPAGGSFQPRCPRAFAACADEPPPLIRLEIPDPASVACLLFDAAHHDHPEGLITGGGHA
jgi:ABC-type dipeptide/oligopeptide/nickel transport system ATPase component